MIWISKDVVNEIANYLDNRDLLTLICVNKFISGVCFRVKYERFYKPMIQEYKFSDIYQILFKSDELKSSFLNILRKNINKHISVSFQSMPTTNKNEYIKECIKNGFTDVINYDLQPFNLCHLHYIIHKFGFGNLVYNFAIAKIRLIVYAYIFLIGRITYKKQLNSTYIIIIPEDTDFKLNSRQ